MQCQANISEHVQTAKACLHPEREGYDLIKVTAALQGDGSRAGGQKMENSIWQKLILDKFRLYTALHRMAL